MVRELSTTPFNAAAPAASSPSGAVATTPTIAAPAVAAPIRSGELESGPPLQGSIASAARLREQYDARADLEVQAAELQKAREEAVAAKAQAEEARAEASNFKALVESSKAEMLMLKEEMVVVKDAEAARVEAAVASSLRASQPPTEASVTAGTANGAQLSIEEITLLREQLFSRDGAGATAAHAESRPLQDEVARRTTELALRDAQLAKQEAELSRLRQELAQLGEARDSERRTVRREVVDEMTSEWHGLSNVIESTLMQKAVHSPGAEQALARASSIATAAMEAKATSGGGAGGNMPGEGVDGAPATAADGVGHGDSGGATGASGKRWSNEWNGEEWIASLGIHRHIAKVLLARAGSAHLVFVRSLAADDVNGRDAVLALLRVGLLEELAETIWNGMVQLRESRAASAASLHSKFVTEENTFTLAYGGLDAFFGGAQRSVAPMCTLSP